MRKTDDQKQAAYEQRIAQLRAKVKRIEQRKTQQERRDRIHVGVAVGWGMIDHAMGHPKSEVRRVLMAVIKNHLGEYPDDRAMADLVALLSDAPASDPVQEAAE